MCRGDGPSGYLRAERATHEAEDISGCITTYVRDLSGFRRRQPYYEGQTFSKKHVRYCRETSVAPSLPSSDPGLGNRGRGGGAVTTGNRSPKPRDVHGLRMYVHHPYWFGLEKTRACSIREPIHHHWTRSEVYVCVRQLSTSNTPTPSTQNASLTRFDTTRTD